MKVRVQLSLDPQVYALIKDSQANKSSYVERLIVEDFKEKKKESIVEGVKDALLEDAEFQQKFRRALTGGQTGEFSAPETYA